MSHATTNSTQPTQIEPGIYNIPIQLAEVLKLRHDFFQSTLCEAQRRLVGFAQKHNWQVHIQEPFAANFHVHADKASFDHDLLETCGLDTTTELPTTYCAALEQGILMSVSPELYRTLYPEGDEENAFEKLLTHEMAHRLHIRILGGNEEAMGPIWFYEGFALHAAGQFENNMPQLNTNEIWEIVGTQERGSYKQYAAVFQYFLGKAPIQQLIEIAGRDDFMDRLKKIGT